MIRRAGLETAFALAILAQAGCAASAPPADPTSAPAALAARQTEWTHARQLLSLLRSSEPVHPYVAELTVALHERVSGRGFGARGALAVDPHRALRLVLLGPGGATALDLWVTPTRYRLSVPSMDLLKRGGTSTAGSAGLPVAFFRWWFLAPLEGRLLTSVATPLGNRFIVRNETATVDLLDRQSQGGHVLSASRREPGREGEEHLGFEGAGFVPSAGDRAVYDDATSGVHVEVLVESLSDAPDPLAFADPDGTVTPAERLP
jgi:hypothetical protein